MVKYSLVIPCYNEADNLPELINRCHLLANITELEVIFVNNGSTDNTKSLLPALISKHKQFRCIHIKKNTGYGYGILAGLNTAKGQILGWTHADIQTDPTDFIKAINFFGEGTSSTFVKGKRYGRPIFDTIFTFGMSIFETIFLRELLIDINAQPTVFQRDFYESWQNPPKDFSLDLYAYFLAKQGKFKIRRFPVRFGPRLYGKSSWNTGAKARLNFILRTLQFSIRLKGNLKRGNYSP